ncbi:MAG TPA: SDR family oxidoreductase [Caulobacteraceae bacterium]|jgi:NAD(P)-dependent dehydrogenase (short-subunit alcohol dehydrogenase family)|nr:SDR family oxidoreductase [Caulobacteraceae bacterium]
MSERTALVVGASRGLGLGVVRELLGRGWRVIATVRGPSAALSDVAAASGGRVRIEALDLEDGAAIDALPARLAGETLDLLFVNAGINPRGQRVGTVKAEDVARLFLTNSVAPVHVAETLVGQVREGTGVIALMSSGLGRVGGEARPLPDLYGASKAALNKLARGFAGALGGRKLTVVSVDPGWVRTDMGGPGAPLSVEESCKGVVDMLEAKAGTGEHGFYNYTGQTVAW